MKFKANKFLITWLKKACILIFVMVTIGGITHLTHSGLSIVEREPLISAFPPISHDSWQEKFELYKQFPEY
jgi:cytochrome c oxidase assembly protein subunit 15